MSGAVFSRAYCDDNGMCRVTGTNILLLLLVFAWLNIFELSFKL
jgi:hypothetical protein